VVADAAMTFAVDPIRRPPDIFPRVLDHPVSFTDRGRC
jgi:hypothetical protein